MNFDRLRFVAEEAELGEAREAILAVTIPERPGSFKTFCSLIGPRNITEFNYRYADPSEAQVFVGVQVRDRAETDEPGAPRCRRKGLEALDFTDNELAKLHVRHLVGGHAPGRRRRDPLSLRVPGAARRADEVPERDEPRLEHQPVPLSQPRRRLRPRARRHAGAGGRQEEVRGFPRRLGYPFRDESRNPAYRLFLG